MPLPVPVVRFTDKYALRAFEAGALDYLLKPFDNARFELALDRAKERILQGRRSPRTRELLAVKSAGQLTFLKISRLTGSRLRITTPVCMPGQSHTSCATAWQNSIRSWISRSFAEFTVRLSLSSIAFVVSS